MRLGAFSHPISNGAKLSSIKRDLLSRPPNIIKDVLAPANSRELLQTLYEILPVAPISPQYKIKVSQEPEDRHFFPQGHHLVYFPPSPSKLLRDGTDTLHYPGPPFVRRMWAGGSVSFSNVDPLYTSLRHENRPATCIESIRNVEFKGPPLEEKVFVDIERHINNALSIAKFKQPENSFSVLEKRTLVFLQARDGDQNFKNIALLRFVRPPLNPDFEMEFVPTPSLLSKFSTLSSNHHLIHLSSKYASKVEGYSDMLVHGPLTLVLKLYLLRSQLKKTQMISTLDYRNLAPLYVNEMMRVCGKLRSNGTFKMWIEDSRGSLAVTGDASITTVQDIADHRLPLFKASKSIDIIPKEKIEQKISIRKPRAQTGPIKIRYFGVSDKKSEAVYLARKIQEVKKSLTPILKSPRPIAKMDRLARARNAIQDLAISRAHRLSRAQGRIQSLAISPSQKEPEKIGSEIPREKTRILVPRKVRVRQQRSKQLSTATLRYHVKWSHRSYLSERRMRKVQTFHDLRIKIVDRNEYSMPTKSKYAWWNNWKNRNPDLMRLATYRSDTLAGWREVNMDAWIRKWRVTLWENRLRARNRLSGAFKNEEDIRTRKENLKLVGELSEMFKAKAVEVKGDEGVIGDDEVKGEVKGDEGNEAKGDDVATKGLDVPEHEIKKQADGGS